MALRFPFSSERVRLGLRPAKLHLTGAPIPNDGMKPTSIEAVAIHTVPPQLFAGHSSRLAGRH